VVTPALSLSLSLALWVLLAAAPRDEHFRMTRPKGSELLARTSNSAATSRTFVRTLGVSASLGRGYPDVRAQPEEPRQGRIGGRSSIRTRFGTQFHERERERERDYLRVLWPAVGLTSR